MATFDTALAGGAILRLDVSLASQDVNSNSSIVNWALYLIKGSYSSWTATAIGWSTNIGGAGYSGSYTFDFRSSSSKTIAAGSTQLWHNADGTLTFYAGGHTNATGTSTGGPADTGGNVTLPTIPRASSFSSYTNPVTAGTTLFYNINRASGSFTHTVQYFFGSASGTIANNVATSGSWNVPLSLLNQIPNSVSGSGILRLITYSGGTMIGYNDWGLTITAGGDIVPTLSGLTDSESVSSIASIVGQYVQGLSKPTLGITSAAGVYGSTIRSYSITVDGLVVNAQSGTVPNPLPTAGTRTITATVTDSRGRTASITKNITVLAYAPPQINSSSTQRAVASGTPAEEGTYIRVNLNASATDLTVGGVQKNKLVYKISTRPRGTSVWSLQKTVTVPASGITFNSYDLVSSYAIEDSWEVLTEVSDQFNTSSVQSTIATAKIFMHWGGQDEGLGIGKFWERGAVDILGQAYQNDGFKIIDEASLITKQAKLGTIDPYWTAGLPKVQLDGNLSFTGGYMWDRGSSGTWRPTPGQRVYLTPSAIGGYIISGPVAETNVLMNAVPITTWFATAGVYDLNWHLPSVSMTSDGLIIMQGLWKFGTSPGAVDTKFAQLPDPRYYPDRQFTFTVSANQTICRIQVRTDGSLWYINSASGNPAGAYFSLSGVRYPAPGVATWQAVQPYSTTPTAGLPYYASANISGTVNYWIDPYGLMWLSGQYTSTTAITADNTPIIQANGAWTIAYQQHLVAPVTGGVPIGFGAIESSATTNPNALVHKGTTTGIGANGSVIVDGQIIRLSGADSGGLLVWTGYSFLNSWKARTSTSFPSLVGWAYRGDLMIQRGLIDSGSSSNVQITTMPAGIRPIGYDRAYAGVAGIIHPAWSNGAVGRLDMSAQGALYPQVGSNVWFSLDNHTWIPEQ